MELVESQRRRVLFALAEITSEKGYAATTVAGVARLAGIDSRGFYRLFAGKHEALGALHELYFQQLMAVSAGVFFTDGSWPERVWAAKGALAQCVEENPILARACFIESHAGERSAVARVEDLTSAFTMFLQDGYEHAPPGEQPSRLASRAIVQANFEIAYHQARLSSKPQMAGVLGHTTHLCLAPFIGAKEANELIDEKLTVTRPAPTEPRHSDTPGVRAGGVRATVAGGPADSEAQPVR